VGWENEHSSLISNWQARLLTQALLCLHVLLDSNSSGQQCSVPNFPTTVSVALEFKTRTCYKGKSKKL